MSRSLVVTPLQYVARIRYGMGQPPPLTDDGGIPIIRATNIDRGRITSANLQRAHLGVLPLDRAPLLSAGEILIVRSGAYTGDSALVSEAWAGSAPGYDLRVTPGPGVDPRFLSWCLLSRYCLDQFDLLKTRAAQPHLNAEELSSLRVPAPPLEMQQRIADYLDTETARIDDLVDMNNRLSAASLERLHRLVVESTLGRPRRPDAQDLGEAFDGVLAPVHTVARVGTGHTPSRNVSEYWQDCDIPWLNIPDLAEARDFWRDEVTDTAEHLNAAGLENSAAVLCPIGTVFVTRTASIGHAAVNAVPMATNQRLVTYYPDSRRLDAHFLLWSIRALKLIGHFDRLTFGATHDTIYYDDMVALRVPLRDLVEQQAAVVAIAELRNEVAALRERLERSSRLLRERRQALITAAVTGELEV